MNNMSAPSNLRCEYLHNPIGLDLPTPRLSWEVQDDRRGAKQTAYQILVAASTAALTADNADIWDTGKVDAETSIHIPYAGPALSSRQCCYWKVRTWDRDGVAASWSEISYWEMGLLARDEWKGEWIGSALTGGKNTDTPCPFLRKEFCVEEQIVAARLYVTALGVYEFHLNGQVVGEDLFTPGWTEYRKRVQYQVYDVTCLLHDGKNAAGAILGNGWYSGYVGFSGRQCFGNQPRLLAQLELTLADGRVQVISTDDSWKLAYGPLLESDFQMGESYDARQEMPGWDAASFDDSAWCAVTKFADPGILLSGQRGPTVRRIQELAPIADPVYLSHGYVFDLGQNMVGRVRLKISGAAGTTVKLRFAEILNADGTIYTANLRSARATDYYTLKGEGEEIFEPRSTFHGFRYVELSNYPGVVTKDMITGIVIHSATPPSGTFECSDPLLNQLQHNIIWGQKGNFLEVPTDCPQRDERLGWTGDAQVFIRTATFNMQVASFFSKWMQDVADSQTPKGSIPMVVPDPGYAPENDGGPAWADAAVICPWTVYLAYGDTGILAENYQMMIRFVEYLYVTSRGFIRNYDGYQGFGGFGDWLSINAVTSQELIGTAFFAYCTQLVSEIARILGHIEDAEKYSRRFTQIRQAFIDRYITKEGLVVDQTQTAYILALHFGLMPDDLRDKAGKLLVRDIQNRNLHLSTGFVGSPYINHVLTQTGHQDTAYQLLHQTSWPSWLYPVTQGATTIWERWDGWTHDKGFQDPGMNSFNHYAYGAIGAWLYAVVAGLDIDPAAPGFKHSIIKPRPGGGLTHAKASHHTMYGLLESGWRIEGNLFILEILVPANTTATVYVPTVEAANITESGVPAAGVSGVKFIGIEEQAAVYLVGAGRYCFTAIVA